MSVIRQAIDSGRVIQARQMIAAEMARGASGDTWDRLLAQLALAEKRNDEALARYEALAARHPDEPAIIEYATIAALRAGNLGKARSLAERAVALDGASWRAWNARAVIADLQQQFDVADSAYARAAALAPDSPEVLNNQGWSLILRGEWASALLPLEKAASEDRSSRRIANNLELARAALAADLPARRKGESATAFAARLNDAGVAAEMRGDTARAVAAFSQAIDARALWYQKAADNLDRAGKKR
jgi:Flp pilus assembly protein TadD